MKPYLLAILLLLSGNIIAQNTNLERMEKLAKEISALQYSANGLTYNIDNSTYKISFSKSSLVFYLNNLTASQSYYSELNSKDTLFLIENIPLANVSSITLNVVDDLYVYVLSFPSNIIKEQKYFNGKLTGSTMQNYVYLFSNAGKFDEQFSKLGLLIHLIKEEKNILAKGKADKIDAEVIKFLKADQTLAQRTESVKKLLSINMGVYQNVFQQVLKNDEERIAHYKKTGSEYRIIKSRIDAELKNAMKSYTNYNSYFVIDTMATAFLKKYDQSDFEGNEYNTIKKIGADAGYRYQWNKEFAQKYPQVQAYDQLKAKLAERQAHSSRMVAKTYSGGALVRTFMLTFGAIAAGMGTYGVLDKEESAFSKSTSETMLIAGASTVATSLLWSGIIKARIANANKKYNRTQREITERQKVIETLLQKRNEKLDGIPVIHENK